MSTHSLPLLLAPEQLAPRLGQPDLCVVHVSSPDSYAAGHVPGALFLPPGALMLGQPPAPGRLPNSEQLQALYRHLGLTPETHVVASDDEGSGWAGRLLWTLEVLGHRRVSVLDGGIIAWRDAGLPVDTTPHQAAPGDHTPGPVDARLLVETDELLNRLDAPGLVVWDARSRDEYLGLRSASARHGHIPGARHLDWLDLMDRDHGLRLKPLDTLRQLLEERGILPASEIITHCQSHHRSGLSYLVGRLLGLNIRAYHGSWGEWGNRTDTPIRQGDTP